MSTQHSSPQVPTNETQIPSPRKRHFWRRAVIGLGGGVLVLVAAYLVSYLIVGDSVPRHATVAGVAVGGLDRDAAAARLADQLADRAKAPITVRVGKEETTVDPAAAGLEVDPQASIERAGGNQSLSPKHLWNVVTGGSAVDPVVQVDEDRLARVVDDLAKHYQTDSTDASLRFEGDRIRTTDGVDAITLRPEAAAQALIAGYLDSAVIELPVSRTPPEITTQEVANLVQDYAEPAVAAPIVITAEGAGKVTISTTMIGKSISFEPADGTLQPRLAADRLYQQAKSAIDEIELTKPKDASIKIRKGKPVITPSVDGTTVAEDDLADAVQSVLIKPAGQREAEIELSGADASFSTEDAEKLGVTEVTGEFTTHFPYAEYRNVNIGRAAEKINGTLLKPGDVFSLNKIVGERTRANGFIEGTIISGNKFKEELGGGVSQSATTTFNAMFFAGLKDVEHRPHSLFIDRYPAGREATVAWPTLDLKFANDTDYGVLVEAVVRTSTPSHQGSITVRMWSTKTYDSVKSSQLKRSNFTSGREIWDTSSNCQEMYPVQGFDVNYSRLFSRDDQVVKTEDFHWRYAPTDRVHCGKKP